MAKITAKTHVADVCLYGNGPAGCGAGWLAASRDGGRYGDGEPVSGWSFTQAVWDACDALAKAGHAKGRARVFAAGGAMFAWVDLSKTAPYFGDLEWVPVSS